MRLLMRSARNSACNRIFAFLQETSRNDRAENPFLSYRRIWHPVGSCRHFLPPAIRAIAIYAHLPHGLGDSIHHMGRASLPVWRKGLVDSAAAQLFEICVNDTDDRSEEHTSELQS